MDSPALILTIVICTRNRFALLKDLLSTIAQQKASNDLFEVLIVDNASTDRTHQTVLEQQKGFPANLRYVMEPQVGLSFARNKGWKEAGGEYVAYLDDECRLPPEWLKVAHEIISSSQPDAFGGPIYPSYASEKPRWFKDSYECADEGVEAGPLMEDQYLSGGNMVFRREILQRSGGFVSDLGMSGNNIAYGEETFFLKQLRQQNSMRVYYDRRLHVFHLIRPEKMTMLYIAKSKLAFGRSFYRIWGGDSLPQSRTALYRKLFWLWRQFFKEGAGALFRDRKKYPFFQNYLFESTFKRLIEIGRVKGRLDDLNRQTTT